MFSDDVSEGDNVWEQSQGEEDMEIENGTLQLLSLTCADF